MTCNFNIIKFKISNKQIETGHFVNVSMPEGAEPGGVASAGNYCVQLSF